MSNPRERALREAVARRRGDLIDLAAELVRHPSTLGAEEEAQCVVAAALDAAGFLVERVCVDAEAALQDPSAGYPLLSYEGRTSVVGTMRGSGGGRSLHLSGHIDVVPVERMEDWSLDPWAGTVSDGKLWGRGAGDMKGGLAAYLTAAAAVAEVCTDLRGDLRFSSVIEEECGGNGMWSVLRAGHSANATLIGEATGLTLGRAGIGVVWAKLVARHASGHAEFAGRDGPFDDLCRAVGALRTLEAETNELSESTVFAEISDWPYGMTIGRIDGGVWTSSAPAELTAHVRFGFGPSIDPADVQARMVHAIAEATPRVEVTFEGFRARAYVHDDSGALVELLAAAHQRVLGSVPEPRAFTATTDARFVQDPCLCYGPVAANLHGTDEWVDIESLERTAAVVAVFAADWLS
jgi:acetylornithine deacetylase